MLGFLLGLGIGVVGTGVAFIVFGKNNKNKINTARAAIIEAYDKVKDRFDGDDDAKKAVENIR